MKIINYFITIFLIFLINSNNNSIFVNSQYTKDICEVSTNITGIISPDAVIPQTCFRIIPTINKAYLTDSITINILSATVGENTIIKVIGGSNILSDSPVLTINQTLTDSLEPITINNGMVIIYIDYISLEDNVTDTTFTLSYASSNEKHLKPSVVGLISVAVAFGVPLIVVTFVKCLIPKSTKKEKATSIKKIFFWISFILGLVFLAIILSRKAGV